MKVVFFSNFMNHHQLPFSRKMAELIGDDYSFIATTPFIQSNVSIGYKDMNSLYPFIIRAYEGEKEREKAFQLARDADVMISGSAPEEYSRERIKSGKILFRYSERPFKTKNPWYKYPYRLLTWRRKNPPRKPVYMLCASAYTAADYASLGLFRNKCFKWGYFPEVKQYNISALIADKKKHSLLWAGRMLDWKHPDAAVRVAEKLKGAGYSFQLNIIGSGELYEQLEKMIEEKNLGDCVSLLGSMPPDEVRCQMEESEIFLFTSDRNEGWGAVLNESMNSGCAVVANDEIGSVPFLLKDGENGFIYHSGNEDELYDKVKQLLDNKKLREKCANNAYKTLSETWNADVASERLLILADKLQNGEETPFTEGPCSKAEIIRYIYYERKLTQIH